MTDFDGWLYIRAGFCLHGPGDIRNNLIQDIFAWGNAATGLTAYGVGGSNANNRLIRATICSNGLGEPVPREGKGTSVTQDVLSSFSQVQDCNIEGTSHNGEGARMAHRYMGGQLTDEPLWPWPMQDRIMAELGIDVTGEMTQLLEKNGVKTGGQPSAVSFRPELNVGRWADQRYGAVMCDLQGRLASMPEKLMLTRKAEFKPGVYLLKGSFGIKKIAIVQ